MTSDYELNNSYDTINRETGRKKQLCTPNTKNRIIVLQTLTVVTQVTHAHARKHMERAHVYASIYHNFVVFFFFFVISITNENYNNTVLYQL